MDRDKLDQAVPTGEAPTGTNIVETNSAMDSAREQVRAITTSIVPAVESIEIVVNPAMMFSEYDPNDFEYLTPNRCVQKNIESFPSIKDWKVVKKITCSVIGDDRIWKLNNIVKCEVERLYEYFDTIETQEEIRVILTPENARWKKEWLGSSHGSVLMCAYNATKEYLKHLLGIELDNDDASWYRSHPLTEQRGLPEEHTITVLNDLVKPYGIGVSHVYAMKGTSAYPEQLLWQNVLGTNSEGLLNHNMSNAEWLDSLGLDEATRPFMETQAAGYHFEYVDRIPDACIAMSGSGGAVGASAGGGHTTYYGPRKRVHNFKLGIKYDRIANINYNVPANEIPTTEVTESESEAELILDWNNCLSNIGKTIMQSTSPNSTYSPRSSVYDHSQSSTGGGWQNPNTARQFIADKKDFDKFSGSPKGNSKKGRKTKNGKGNSYYNNFTAQEKGRFSRFLVNCCETSVQELKDFELVVNQQYIVDACDIISTNYRNFNIKEAILMCGADNWRDMRTDVRYGSTFKEAVDTTIKQLGPLNESMTIMDWYMVNHGSKTVQLEIFVQAVINNVIYASTEESPAEKEFQKMLDDPNLDPNVREALSRLQINEPENDGLDDTLNQRLGIIDNAMGGRRQVYNYGTGNMEDFGYVNDAYSNEEYEYLGNYIG